MRGALMDATLPVVRRRTCVCPSRLLAAAVNCVVILCRDKVAFASPEVGRSSDRHHDELRTITTSTSF